MSSLQAKKLPEILLELPPYEPVSGVYGTLNSIGSDTLNNMMALWAEAFQRIYPGVSIQIEGKGSSTAPPALAKGTAQIGPMSREMKPSELATFEQQHGYKPTRIAVAIDSLSVFVHRDNPLPGITLDQLDGLYSSTMRRSGQSLQTWKDLGVTSPLGARRISLFGRNSASGTYGLFKESVLLGGDFLRTVKEQLGTSAVVQGVALDPSGIGFGGIGYRTSAVRVLPISDNGQNYVEPSYQSCLSGEYPLARYLFIYINKPPNEEMDTLTREFVRFVFSREGQAIVMRDGYYPVPAQSASEMVATLVN